MPSKGATSPVEAVIVEALVAMAVPLKGVPGMPVPIVPSTEVKVRALVNMLAVPPGFVMPPVIALIVTELALPACP